MFNDLISFDDIILKEERRIISELEIKSRVRCQHLKKWGDFYYYCGLSLNNNDKSLNPLSPVYQRHVDCIELQLHCMDNYEGCCFYNGRLER